MEAEKLPDPTSAEESRSELRSLLGIVLVALGIALLCVILAGLYVGQALKIVPSSSELTKEVRKKTRTFEVLPDRISESVDEATSAQTWCGPVTFIFQTPDGAPVQGSALLHWLHGDGSDPEFTTLDADGRMTVDDARCSPQYSLLLRRVPPSGSWYDVEAEPGKDTHVVVVGPLGESEVRRQRREEICPLRVSFVHADGTPVSARVRMAHVGERTEWFELDAEGGFDIPDANCTTRPRFLMKQESGGRAMQVSLRREPDDLPELVHVIGGTAQVRIVDDSGERIEDVELDGVRAERLSSGDFEITGNGEEEQFGVQQSDHLTRGFSVPLDGGLHEVEVKRERRVEVTLLCDQCTGSYACESNDCEGTAPDLVCTCPGERSVLVMRTQDSLWGARSIYDLIAVVPADVDSLTVEIPGERAQVRFEVAAQPDTRFRDFLFVRPGSREEDWDFDSYRWRGMSEASFERIGQTWIAHEVLPGDWDLVWRQTTYVSGKGWEDAGRSLAFSLKGGEDLDLGIIRAEPTPVP